MYGINKPAPPSPRTLSERCRQRDDSLASSHEEEDHRRNWHPGCREIYHLPLTCSALCPRRACRSRSFAAHDCLREPGSTRTRPAHGRRSTTVSVTPEAYVSPWEI